MKRLKLTVYVAVMLCATVVAQSQSSDSFPSWKWVIEPQFEVASSFYEGLASIRKNGKWGFIDKTGAIVIEPEFDGVKNFSDGMAGIKLKGKWGYINHEGEIVIKPKYYAVYNFRDDIARVERYENDEDYFINRNGNQTPVVPTKNKSRKLTPRPENNSTVFQSVKNGKYGFVDKNNNWVIPAEFVGVRDFSDNLACVNQNGKWGFIKLFSPHEYMSEYIKTKASQSSDAGAEITVLFGKAIEEFAESSLFQMELSLSNISDYDELNSTFLVSMNTLGKLVLKVEKEDSRSLKANWARVKFSEPVFVVAKNSETGQPQIVLKSIKITNTVNKKVHEWNSIDRFAYKDSVQEQIFEYVNMNEAFKDAVQ
ncbi:MAG: WG repeat-containing protein [Prevotellaceae bacterium]|jgi:hypothetical protein|nr:WG repeat-containing protein [Prevotellaceae bacterium]